MVLLVFFGVLFFIVYIPSCFKAIVCRIIYSMGADRYAGIPGGEDAMRATVNTNIVREMASIVTGLQGQPPEGHPNGYPFLAGR